MTPQRKKIVSNKINNRVILLIIIFLLFAIPHLYGSNVDIGPNEVGIKLSLEGQNFTKAVNIFILMTILSLVPAFIMMMTSFTRIVIVLGFLKKALGTQQAPSSKIITSLALFLTFFIMEPVWQQIYNNAIVPFSKKEIAEQEAMAKTVEPLKTFMLSQTREDCLGTFMGFAKLEPIKRDEKMTLPMRVVIPAFMVSELETAFKMGFLIYLPFLIIDAVVATFLMSMGMMMLPPMMISLPFKLLLFIMVDGWQIVVQALVSSFG